MVIKPLSEPQNPLILRFHRLMEAFAKSDDERDFYIDRNEGFLIYVDLDKSETELTTLESELQKNHKRYCLIPKLTFYETKKIMEGFINEKVYDIDTKEKLLDIIQSREARENFLEFIYDHHAEFEKWQLYYQERSRVRIIEWLRNNHFHFVFEEDLDLPKASLEKVKKHLFVSKVGKDILTARKSLFTKAKTYYSNEALNPRPKRGRPPKQVAKLEVEPQFTPDAYTTVEPSVRPFLFSPDVASASVAIFSSKFETDEKLTQSKKLQTLSTDSVLQNLNQKLASLRSLSSRWLASESQVEVEKGSKSPNISPLKNEKAFDEEFEEEEDFDSTESALEENEEEDFDEFEEEELSLPPQKMPINNIKKQPAKQLKSKEKQESKKPMPPQKPQVVKPLQKIVKPLQKKQPPPKPLKKSPVKVLKRPPVKPVKKIAPPKKPIKKVVQKKLIKNKKR